MFTFLPQLRNASPFVSHGLLDFLCCIPTADNTSLRINTVIDTVSEHILLFIVTISV